MCYHQLPEYRLVTMKSIMKPNINSILKRFCHLLSAWILVFCGITSSLGISVLSAQTAIGPEQDCFAALPVVRSIIVQQTPYSGAGGNTGDIASNVGCPSSAERILCGIA
jgi:hypothetical protein